MSRDPTAVSAFGRLFALVGGLVFIFSLIFAVYRYLEFGWHDWRQTPWSWQRGWRPVVSDVLLFSVFALHHSLFARAGLKAHVSRLVSPALERAVYVWIASLLFVVVCAAWQPVPGILWDVAWPYSLALLPVQLAGLVMTLRGATRLDVLDLAGVRQAFGLPTRRRSDLIDDGFYGFVRHPIYLGWLLLVWPTGAMTGTRLVFAAVSCLYLLAAVPIEERDLRRTFGTAYEDYARRVRWRIVPYIY